jgi:hypothetical protein
MEIPTNWTKPVIILVLFVRPWTPYFGQEAHQATSSGLPKVVSVLGLENVKWNSTGTLTVQDGKLQFKSAKAQAEINTSSIRDVFTAEDSQRMLGGTVGTVTTIAAPYGSGRIISLFREKIDALTLEFDDVNGGLHGAIFTLPKGQAEPVKKELLTQGAHSLASPGEAQPGSASNRPGNEPAPGGAPAAAGQLKLHQKTPVYALQIQSPEPGEVKFPPEFRVAVYENLIVQLHHTGKFTDVYRIGDGRAASVPELLYMRMKLVGFKEGSQKKREVTTVSGATSIKVRLEIATRDGALPVDRDVEGKVRFLGDNLRATYDLSKSVANIVKETF